MISLTETEKKGLVATYDKIEEWVSQRYGDAAVVEGVFFTRGADGKVSSIKVQVNHNSPPDADNHTAKITKQLEIFALG